MAVLSPLSEFGGERKVTVSAILPLLSHIQDSVLGNEEGETYRTREIKTRIRSNLESRYDEETTHSSMFAHSWTLISS